MAHPHPEAPPAPRIGVKLPVTLIFEDGITAEGISQNMSETGVLVIAYEERPPGTRATLKFQAFDAMAEIVWTSKEGGEVRIGMKFVSIDQRGLEFVRGFAEYLRAHQYPR